MCVKLCKFGDQVATEVVASLGLNAHCVATALSGAYLLVKVLVADGESMAR